MAELWTPKTEAARAVLLRWVEERVPDVRFENDKAIATGVVRGDELMAVAVYHEHRGSTVEMTIAADTPRWATKRAIAGLLATAFDGLAVRRITAIVHSDNRRSRRFVEGIGFCFEGSHRDAFKDGDAISYGMTRRWWLTSRWKQERQAARRAA